jgi:hypothetical protein
LTPDIALRLRVEPVPAEPGQAGRAGDPEAAEGVVGRAREGLEPVVAAGERSATTPKVA